MADESLDKYLTELRGRLVDTTVQHKSTIARVDPAEQRVKTRAPNAIEWAVRPEFLNVQTIFHHKRQYEIIRDFFQLRCPLPSCNDQSREARDPWDKTREYLESENLLVWNNDKQLDMCPSCGMTRPELIQDGLLKNNNQMHIIAGMRSGKSSTASVMGTYIEHVLLHIGHTNNGGLPAYFSGLLPNQPLEMAFIASTDVQSADTIWAMYNGLRQNSEWFKNYIRWIKNQEKAQGVPDGVRPWAYEERSKEIIHGALNLKIVSLTSNSSGLAGRTRVASFIDELARFENTEGARGADEAYRVLENALITVRGASTKSLATPWLGTMISISSPISRDDKAMKLLGEASNIKGMYSGHYATWDFNPDLPRSYFDDMFAKDPIGTMRDFGAQPPTVASPLILDANRFKQLAVDNNLRPTAQFVKLIHKDLTDREYISAKVQSCQLSLGAERYISFDAGQSHDQFAGACAHGEWVITPEGKQLITVYDWVFRLIPDRKPQRDIWFEFVKDAILYMSKCYNIARIDFDRWQSTALIQNLRDMGIYTEMSGTTADDFNKLLNDVTYNRVRMLPPMPDDHLVEPPQMSAPGLAFYELERLQRSDDLKKVFNPKKGERIGYNSDDVATVVAHCNRMVQNTVIAIDNSHNKEAVLRREQSSGYSNGMPGKLFRMPGGSKRSW
jgi:hypothetical protein